MLNSPPFKIVSWRVGIPSPSGLGCEWLPGYGLRPRQSSTLIIKEWDGGCRRTTSDERQYHWSTITLICRHYRRTHHENSIPRAHKRALASRLNCLSCTMAYHARQTLAWLAIDSLRLDGESDSIAVSTTDSSRIFHQSSVGICIHGGCTYTATVHNPRSYSSMSQVCENDSYQSIHSHQVIPFSPAIPFS